MNVLAIDTSNYALGIALMNEDGVIGEYITNMKKNHSIRVMPAIEKLLFDCEMKPADLDKVIVAKGPGSYTGVRIGVTIAKTLAWTLSIPLAGVSSLEILAAGAGRYFNGCVSPLFDARRGQIYTGLYQSQNGKLVSREKDQLVLSKNWAEQLKEGGEKILFIGSDVKLHQEIFEQVLGEKAIFAEITEHNPRPSELALLGYDKPEEDIHTFVPNYIRLAEAEAKWIEAQKEMK
ncbi:tRNA (adenosine(37)-N6)-threonylcarbamoyltransferase complex dimerization subunit type 1 TsaB [Niallia endozanthoxylica]|uniref:tRNA (Adenosine(37)-N6)-threonylcarbamoyltransferase complex dimerization subunit type 1 TsaB n=1 Tax=Niallia endozanthoxylica TaxID=2036016 RepID=A0A5J5H5U2_9BACI|nr:tRNA (adenosine(37)-N6)-threonylcarbamoyltransferase complex dimerization subunit type 1 TsaB [Niallia endozanthoxylica]KAA9016045.1 tRNA (adenosine(37)-N6)-threonylcarbamoyltransferase complex dimerization subunit type 1 TsaB [Niallia endozanthoxylica]